MAARPRLQIAEKNDLPQALVSGGAGFIGSCLCQSLLLQNCRVLATDNLESGRKENIRALLANRNFTFLELDLTKPLPSMPSPDYIFHLAGIEEYLNDTTFSLDTLLLNSQGTLHLLDLARKTKAKFLLGSTLAIYSGIFSTEKITSDTQNSSHEAKRFSETLTSEYFKRFGVNCRIVRFLDVYGPKMSLNSTSEVAKLLVQTKEGKELVVEGDGLRIIYPTYIDDVVEGILKATFSPYSAGKIYNLVSPEKITVLDLTKEIQHRLPQLKIRKEEKEKEFFYPLPQNFSESAKDLGWEPKISFQAGIAETLDWLLGEDKREIGKVEEKKSVAVKEQKEDKSESDLSVGHPLKRYFLWTAVFLASFLLAFKFLFPVGGFIWDAYWGIKDLDAIELKENLKLEKLAKKAGGAEHHFQRAQTSLTDLSWMMTLTRQEEREADLQNKLFLAQNFATGIKHALVAAENVNQALRATLGKSSGDVNLKITQAKEELETADEVLETVWAEVKNQKKLSILGKDQTDRLHENLPKIRQMVAQGRSFLAAAPNFLGISGKKTYLLLLQNNMELRPTGGFIGSYGILTFEKGQMSNLRVEDVYTADGQLKGHVEPPPAVKKYLKEHWFLRDSNWDPDFPLSAQKAEWFLEKETGQVTDGVVAFDLGLIQSLLSALGQVTLPDYQETITADNLFEKAEKHAEIDFFPGSTQKKDFLGALSRRLIEKLTNEENIKWLTVLEAVNKSLAEKHLLFYFNDPTLQNLVQAGGFGGEVKDLPTFDYLMINDANVGMNKANAFLERKINYEVTIGEQGEVENKLTIFYENKSPADAWPGGKSGNYLRVYLPLGTVIDGATLNGKTVQGVEVTISSGKTVFGLYFEVPVGEMRQLNLSYRLPSKIRWPFDSEKSVYDLYAQKQPGTDKDPLTLIVNYPTNLEIAKTDPQASMEDQSLAWFSDLSTDRKFLIEFKK